MAEVWTAQLHIAGGEASEDAPEIAYAERLDDAGRTARLYLLAEPDRPGSEQFIADLVTDLGEEFVAGSGSLTGLIQRAIRERHLDLLDWNRNSLPHDQASYGLSCLIQRADEWFLAQIGPSLVYYREGERLLRRRPSSERANTALGTSEVAAPEFSQLDLQPGEWALLISSTVAQALPDQAAAALRALRPEDVLPAIYPHVRGMERLSALVVAPMPQGATEAGAPSPSRPAAEQPATAQPIEYAQPDRDTDDIAGSESDITAASTGEPEPPLDPDPTDPTDDSDNDPPQSNLGPNDPTTWPNDAPQPPLQGEPHRPVGVGLGGALTSLRATAGRIIGRLTERRGQDDPWAVHETPQDQPPAPAHSVATHDAPEPPATHANTQQPPTELPDSASAESSAESPAEIAPDAPTDTADDPPADHPIDDATSEAETPRPDPSDPESNAATQLSLDQTEREPDPDPTNDEDPPTFGQRTQEYRFAPADGPWPVNPFSARAAPVLDTAGQVEASHVVRPLFGLAGSVPSFRRRSVARDPNTDEATGPGWGSVLLGLGALLIALAAVAGALLVPELVSDSERDEFGRFVETARDGLTAATLSADPASTRLELQRTAAAAESALELRPLDPDALVLQQEIETALRQVNAIVQPPGLQVVREFGGQAALASIEIVGDIAYTLDEAGGTVVALDFTTGISRTVFAAGEQYLLIGEFASLTSAAPIGMEWTATSHSASLTVLDETGQLFRITEAGGTEAYFLENPEVVAAARAVTANEAGLYLLDSAGVIWLFPFQPDDSLGSAIAAIERTELVQATDLIIVDDDDVGATFLVTSADGRVRRFSEGQDQGFPLDLDRPLLVPASLSIGELSNLVYLTDRGNNRVLVLTPAGEIVAQLRAPQLTGVRGVHVAELDQRVYFVTASTLLVADLPDRLAH